MAFELVRALDASFRECGTLASAQLTPALSDTLCVSLCVTLAVSLPLSCLSVTCSRVGSKGHGEPLVETDQRGVRGGRWWV